MLFDNQANKMIKIGSKSVSQNEMREMVKVVFLHYACCNLTGLGVTNFDEKLVPKWSQQIIKFEPLGAHGCIFRDFVSF